MVGVPGRSKGCLTCRKRKKGCDQQRPVCGQCRRSNLVCQGYPSDLTFVRYSPMRVGSSHFQANVEDNGGPPQKVMRNPSPLGNSDQSLQNTAVDAYMFDNYWHSFFPRAKEDEKKWVPKGDAISSWIPAGWIFEMRSYTGSDQLIRTGLQANAYTIWGRKTDDKRLSVASMQAYSMVLQEVHRCLQDPEKCKQDSLLAACKFLALYEAYQGAGANWERHALGILRVLEVRGAAAHQTGLGHAMFLDARYQGIVASIRRREPTFLCNAEWCTVPFEVAGKDYRHEILDVMTNLPKIQYELDNIKAKIIPGYDTPERRVQYFNLCQTTRTGLENWLDRLRTKFDVDRINLIEEGIPDNFPLSNIMLASVMTLYWASMILVNIHTLHGLRDFPIPSYHLDHDDGTWGRVPNLEVMPYILYIAKSIPFFFQPDAGSICPQTFSFPLGVALNIASYTNASQVPEYRRLLKAFSKGPIGLQIQKFLTSLQLLSDPEAKAPEDEEDEAAAEERVMNTKYADIRRNAQKHHDEGMFIQRPLAATVPGFATAGSS